MPKTVKLEEHVYNRLEAFRGKKETFSVAVDRLLTIIEKVGEIRQVLDGPGHSVHLGDKTQQVFKQVHPTIEED